MYRTQVASDITRDGLGVELVDSEGNIVAEIFRSDRDKTLELSTSGSLPLVEIERLIAKARARLEPFEDGAPLPESPKRV